RAVDRLSDFFRRRGIDAPLSAIDAGLLAGAIQIAPASVRSSAAAVSSGTSVGGTVATLAKGAILMTTKTKLAIAASLLLLLGSSTTVVVVAHNSAAKPAAPVA